MVEGDGGCVGDGQLLHFASEACLDRLADQLIATLQRRGFKETTRIGEHLLLLRPQVIELEIEATHAQLVKFVVSEMVSGGCSLERFDYKARGLYQDVDEQNFFTACEINYLAHRMAFDIQVHTTALRRTEPPCCRMRMTCTARSRCGYNTMPGAGKTYRGNFSWCLRCPLLLKHRSGLCAQH